MPLAVFELEPRTGRTSNLKETDRTPILQQIFKSLGKSDLMKVPLGWDYASNPEPKAMLQEALSELLLAIMSIPGGTEYTAIYVKKVHGERDAGQPPPSATDSWGRVRGPMFQSHARMVQASTDAMVKVAEYNPSTPGVDVYQSGSLDHMVNGIVQTVWSGLQQSKEVAADTVQQGVLAFLRTDPMRVFISKGRRAEELFSALGTKNESKDHERAMDDIVNMMSGGGRLDGRGSMDTTQAAFDALSLIEAETGMCWPGKGYQACKAEQANKKNRAQAMTKLARLLNMFYDMTKHPDQKSKRRPDCGPAVDRAANSLHKQRGAPGAELSDQAKAARLKTADFGEASHMADTARDMKTFQNNVLSGHMGFQIRKDSF